MLGFSDRSAVVAAAGQCCFLIVPGWQGSGPGHWQSIWERKNREFRRVEQSDWHNPRRSDWIRAIHNAIQLESKPVIVVAHSLGCIAVALWAERANGAAQRVAGALLVAPPDLKQRTKLTEPLRDFAPMPQSSLPFPSLLIASENDPYMASPAARSLAAQWGSYFINAGPVGHINCASGFGDWPEGETYLTDLACCGKAGRLSPAH
jgi:uncharacterized protein